MTLTAVPDLSIQSESPEVRVPGWMTGWRLVVLWIFSGVCLFAFIGTPPVTRTQEARVLETAREMLDQPGELDNWLIPELNGVARLRKPPLTYWFSAVAFMAAGVNDAAGRVPTVFLAWLLVGLTFRLADRLLDRRKAFFSAGALVASYLFYRHARLAETDLPAALFVTGAIACFLRAADTRRAIWHHGAAICIGLAFNAKGPPGLFPLAFLLAFAGFQRRWDVASRFVTSGAILVAIICSGAWYAYGCVKIGPKQFIAELREIGVGEGHLGPFYFYIPLILQATAPWSLFVIAGLIAAIARWKSDPQLRAVLLWLATILIPLSLMPQKQPHYALPMMPPLMLLAGWAIDVAAGGRKSISPDGRRDTEARLALPITLVAAAIVAVAGVPAAAKSLLHEIRPLDWTMGAIVTALVLVALLAWMMRSKLERVALLMTLGVMIAMPLLLGFWFPSLTPVDERAIAARIREVSPSGPYCFYSEMHLPLIYYLQTPVPAVANPQKLEATLDKTPLTLIIVGGKENDPREPLVRPPAHAGKWKLTKEAEFRAPPQLFEMYRAQAK